MGEGVAVAEYDPAWPQIFAEIRAVVSGAMGDLALDIEHVGSTAVPGLPAKPIVDIDVIVRPIDVAEAIRCLARIGYVHEGDLGVPGREAFIRPAGSAAHHLYVCPVGNPALQAHLRFPRLPAGKPRCSPRIRGAQTHAGFCGR